jgi:hypothetical protein
MNVKIAVYAAAGISSVSTAYAQNAAYQTPPHLRTGRSVMVPAQPDARTHLRNPDDSSIGPHSPIGIGNWPEGVPVKPKR